MLHALLAMQFAACSLHGDATALVKDVTLQPVADGKLVHVDDARSGYVFSAGYESACVPTLLNWLDSADPKERAAAALYDRAYEIAEVHTFHIPFVSEFVGDLPAGATERMLSPSKASMSRWVNEAGSEQLDLVLERKLRIIVARLGQKQTLAFLSNAAPQFMASPTLTRAAVEVWRLSPGLITQEQLELAFRKELLSEPVQMPSPRLTPMSLDAHPKTGAALVAATEEAIKKDRAACGGFDFYQGATGDPDTLEALAKLSLKRCGDDRTGDGLIAAAAASPDPIGATLRLLPYWSRLSTDAYMQAADFAPLLANSSCSIEAMETILNAINKIDVEHMRGFMSTVGNLTGMGHLAEVLVDTLGNSVKSQDPAVRKLAMGKLLALGRKMASKASPPPLFAREGEKLIKWLSHAPEDESIPAILELASVARKLPPPEQRSDEGSQFFRDCEAAVRLVGGDNLQENLKRLRVAGRK